MLTRSFYLFIFCGLFSCKFNRDNPVEFGQPFDTTRVLSIPELISLDVEQMDTLFCLRGRIKEVSQKDGNWMRLENVLGTPVLVKTRIGTALLPPDLSGRRAYVYGRAFLDTLSVQELRYLAVDAGKSNTEVQSITRPESSIVMEAAGIKLSVNP